MRLKGLIEPLENSIEFQNIIGSFENKKFPVGIYGASESGRGYIISGIFENIDKSMIIITQSDMEAKNLYEDLIFYTNEVYYFPIREMVFYNIDAISGDLRWARLKVINEILNKQKKIIVTSVEAFSAKYTPHNLFLDYSMQLKVGKEIDITEVSGKLIQSGYERVEMVEGKGQFSLRGGILDVFPTCSTYAYRVELFGDEIESIRTFNTESQRSIEKVKKVDIFPAKEVIILDEALKSGSAKLKDEFNDIASKDKDDERIEKLRKILNRNLESLEETGSFEAIDSYLPYFVEEPESLFDYFKDYFFVMDNVQRCKGKLDSTYLEFEENFTAFSQRGDIFPGQGNLLINKEEILEVFEDKNLAFFEALTKTTDWLKPRVSVNTVQVTLNNYQGQLDLLIDDILSKKNLGYKTLILSGTRARGERLVGTLRDRGIESVYRDDVDKIEYGEVVITFGNQLKGFEYPEYKICVISDREVFGEAKRKLKASKSKRKGISKISSFAELKPGDYVVHASHGVGVYKGIKQIDVAGHKRDYLDIVYDKGDKLYVPVDQLDLIQKYIGSEGKAPKVNKLGSAEWQKAKAKARKSINEIAEDLVKLYAMRSTVKGHKFSKDTEWQKQFEDEFPFEETPDQLTSIEEIKLDMESEKPMDRLVCGDVGYGKTEVALRAAFKAVMDGKQVAILVPTTILAEQHYKNIKNRFSDFPIKIDMISRFKTTKQQKETLQKVKEGNLDILIGTHRLVSKDIQFKDLGLLIVDEEQRFGVKQKEKIKGIKKNVDVLTLSATPIPRTLHMSLSGVRDISVIETPPEERYPIQTYVVEQNDQLIRDAILREIGRNGQVYFVYNRVEDIERMAKYVQALVPESKVGVAHGQMAERQLENVMIDFMSGEYNVLVCTTIIETGMDIQNVNTIIIYDADKMGLSQLYQLRGRVGRSNRIAYAYLLYTKDKVLTEVAEKRLKALKDFTELGSGFKIAMRDLEIRGAGNMMGSSQHGHMASIGYDLYCRMLEDTVKLIKGEIQKEPIETTLDIKVDAFIPESYIEDEIQKIEIYKKIAVIEGLEDYNDIKEELEDRYSKIPEPVYNLMDIAYIKSQAKSIFIEEIKETPKEMLFKFAENESDYKNIFKILMEKYKNSVVLKFGSNPYFAFKIKCVKKENVLEFLKEVFNDIIL
ncbi:transcription-repair coupling factor (superfamily II helicase) [Clostridium saccharoperbutylacetonicum]|jgi:transcription-repair coupling factor (superfamily II helicase)|uniref:Transcription-repair-coupling factor n=1 Tax=Clostridium saccharoperbutylacetonicum N1-4(HMT) TaxID=931276 RepID=M1M7K1_9CLOT|nr:transcription-repair coupling factor [Clostridium saccharoperbutylacetonicum]AGF53944.1 transcription-repair-coupling factor Mfd [Clostridium saccharoperbutylacetonicum N1-4(HMT)]NRT59543.1 transcription-repair coupling factor (superfamily II helicase) [Clostridium saccharoperbutylacetonicum]NSB28735.1 transcription-repair coupling factor (superfamily II helicase) [Clostridium saccharoperbutylacetonicum]NSB42226.1 transcription-repair coupling factor (superfamily II helicase) [Clostridium sa